MTSEDKWVLVGLLALSSLQLVQLGLCSFRGCHSHSSIPAHHLEQCSTVSAKPLVQALTGTISVYVTERLPFPSPECTWQRVPLHPMPPNWACHSNLSLEQRPTKAASAQQRSPWPALRLGTHTHRVMMYGASFCPVLQPAPLQNCSLLLWS